jgi:eukaryotic-like serine/threonine-protein kinase
LGVAYANTSQPSLGADYVRKGYELRTEVSQVGRWSIEAEYFTRVTRNMEKARDVYEIWTQTYPTNPEPHVNICAVYNVLGQPEKALAHIQEAVRLDPSSAVAYGSLLNVYGNLGRLNEALAVAQQMTEKHMDTPRLHGFLYRVAFLRRDHAGMEQQMQWAKGKPGEDRWLANYADTLAYFGHLAESRKVLQRASASALRSGRGDLASGTETRAALRDVLYGYPKEARVEIRFAQEHMLPLGGFGIALYYALTGDIVRARSAADDLAKAFPEGTSVRFIYLPTIQAQIALDQGHSSEAIELLQVAAPYENSADMDSSYEDYVLGNAYLAAHRGRDAAALFQKQINDTKFGPLAHLQLGRAYAMAGDTAKAKAAYQDFLELWKDADADIPILKQARKEFAGLQ